MRGGVSQSDPGSGVVRLGGSPGFVVSFALMADPRLGPGTGVKRHCTWTRRVPVPHLPPTGGLYQFPLPTGGTGPGPQPGRGRSSLAPSSPATSILDFDRAEKPAAALNWLQPHTTAAHRPLASGIQTWSSVIRGRPHLALKSAAMSISSALFCLALPCLALSPIPSIMGFARPDEWMDAHDTTEEHHGPTV